MTFQDALTYCTPATIVAIVDDIVEQEEVNAETDAILADCLDMLVELVGGPEAVGTLARAGAWAAFGATPEGGMS